MVSGTDGELWRHLLFRTSRLIKFVERDAQSTRGPGPPAQTWKQPPCIEPVVLIFVNSKSVNKIQCLRSATPGPVLCLLGHTLQPPWFRSNFGLALQLPCTLILSSPLPRLAPGIRSKGSAYWTPLFFTLMWNKVRAGFPRSYLHLEITVWWGNYQKVIRDFDLSAVLSFAVNYLGLCRSAALGLCFLHSEVGVLNETGGFQTL